MNGAQFLCKTLLANQIDVCFANPGTSEMHFVAALDQQPKMRCILGLFEGVVTGAADGYARMAGKPAATLLHLGSGLGNGLANLHNARRAKTPMLNIVGDHAQYHLQYDAPLTSDIQGIAAAVSDHVQTVNSPSTLDEDIARSIGASYQSPGQISTLILPADTAWSDVPKCLEVPFVSRPQAPKASDTAIQEAAQAIRASEAMLLLGGSALQGTSLAMAYTVAKSTSSDFLAETSNARMERGIGTYPIDKLPYPVDAAIERLRNVRHLILVGARAPVAFFAYPGKPSQLTPEQCQITTLATPHEDIHDALGRLMGALSIDAIAPSPQSALLDMPALGADALSSEALCKTIAALLPDQAIVTDESITQGRSFFGHSRSSARHDYLQLTGGAIGIGLPLATGAAVACPERKVVSLQADGSGMYTVQALWTQARENLNCLTVVFSNSRYAILHNEMHNVGVKELGPNARSMLNIGQPDIDWVRLAQGLGVEAVRADTLGDFHAAFQAGLKHRGPFLIEAAIQN